MKTYVKLVDGKGRAVFAAKHIRKGEVVETSPVLVFTVQTTEMAPFSYEYQWEDEVGNEWKEWWLGLGHTSLYNHHHKPNASFDLIDGAQGPRVKITALRRIARNEEITIDYTGEGEPWPIEGFPEL